jgi:hypothetical protein
MMKRKHMILCTCIYFIASVVIFMPAVSGADSCVNCHRDDKFRVQNRILYDYYQSWKNSVHDLQGISCTECHGGDSSVESADRAHRDGFTSLTQSDAESYKKLPAVCGKCHESVLKNFIQSKHYAALSQKGTGPHCATCHGSMNADVYYTSVISRTCQECHNEYTMNKPSVAGAADKILHRINVSRAYRNWLNTNYADREKEGVQEVNDLYRYVVDAWHTFDFAQLDEKSLALLNTSKALIQKGLAEMKKKQ